MRHAVEVVEVVVKVLLLFFCLTRCTLSDKISADKISADKILAVFSDENISSVSHFPIYNSQGAFCASYRPTPLVGNPTYITFSIIVYHDFFVPGTAPTTTATRNKFTEDFDFQTSNAKFNKEEIEKELLKVLKKVGTHTTLLV